jgi:hypothetical protein
LRAYVHCQLNQLANRIVVLLWNGTQRPGAVSSLLHRASTKSSQNSLLPSSNHEAHSILGFVFANSNLRVTSHVQRPHTTYVFECSRVFFVHRIAHFPITARLNSASTRETNVSCMSLHKFKCCAQSSDGWSCLRHMPAWRQAPFIPPSIGYSSRQSFSSPPREEIADVSSSRTQHQHR